MKKYIFSFAILCSSLFSFAQLSFQIGSASGNKNDTILVPVTVASGFNSIFSAQFSMSYDTNVVAILIPDSLTIVQTSNFSMFYATHVGSLNVKKGQISFSYDAPGGLPKSLNNGTLLFSIRLKLIGKECDSTDIQMTSKPTAALYTNANLDEFPLVANPGKVKINGSGCVVTPPPDTAGVQIIASMDTTPKGIVKCIKVTAKNFKNVQSGQFTMHWDATIAKFDHLNSGAMTLVSLQNYVPLADSSGIRVLWDAGKDPLTVADGTTLFEVCLNPVGAPGAVTAITFDGNPTPIEFYDANNVITVKLVPGKLTISKAPAQILKLYVRDTTVEACGEFCFPIRVDNFTCVDAFEFRLNYDTTKLKFAKISNINLPAFGPGNIVADSNFIKVQYDASAGSVTRPNGDFLFMLCFTSKLAAPNCPFDTKFTFGDLSPSGPLEFSDCNSNNFTVVKGEPNIHVNCCPVIEMAVITLGIATSVKCFGDCNGSIIGTKVSKGKGPFTLEWTNLDSGNTVGTTLDITNLCAGLYILSVTDLGNGNAVKLSDTIRIKSPSNPISATAVISNVVNGSDGAIDLTPSGGTPPYTHVWRRLSSNLKIATTEDVIKQPAGKYSDSIRDANGCLFVDTFMINPGPFKVINVLKIDSSKCFGECKGSLFANASGGVIPYTYLWSNGDTHNPADSLCAGTYTVTATDASGATSTGTYIVKDPDKIDITVDSIIKSSGADGKIYITAKGGTPFRKLGPPYTVQWKNQANPNTVISSEEDLRNAAPGTYTVCITDSLNCVQCLSGMIVMPTIVNNKDTLTINLAIDSLPGNRAVSCHGKCDGKIVATVTSSSGIPKLPYKFRWSHDTTLNSNIATKLCPGQSYSVTVTDAAGNSRVSSSLIISDAPTITLSTKKLKCASAAGALDGSYQAITGGVVLPLQYRWCNGDINQTVNDLPPGNCSIQITDANGCTATETFLVCTDPQNTADCYQGRLAISPNGDGINDVLEIACATDFDNVLNIYDRWGNLVYNKTNYTNDWNGVNKTGESLTEGTYMWVLRVKEAGKNDVYYKGTVTIVR